MLVPEGGLGQGGAGLFSGLCPQPDTGQGPIPSAGATFSSARPRQELRAWQEELYLQIRADPDRTGGGQIQGQDGCTGRQEPLPGGLHTDQAGVVR